MNIEYHKWWSPNLGHDMELKVYGHDGKSMLVFPAQGGRFYEFEDFGMIEACRWAIENGKLKVFTVDSIDNQSWPNWSAHPADRSRRHEDYDRYIVQEVAPFIRGHCGESDQKFLTTGCSMGGYHAGNFFFRHPDVFDGMICLSGLFQLHMFVGDYTDETIYLNSPLYFLPDLVDPVHRPGSGPRATGHGRPSILCLRWSGTGTPSLFTPTKPIAPPSISLKTT